MSGILPRNTAYIHGRRSEILALLAKNESLETVLSAICEAIETIIPSSRSSFMLVIANGDRLTTCAAPSLPLEFLEAINGLEIGDGQGCCGTAAATGKVVITPDIDTDSAMKKFGSVARRAGVRSCWSQPIFAPDGVILGTFAIYKPEPGSPDQDEVETVSAFADLASLAIQFRNNIAAQEEAQGSLGSLLLDVPEIALQWTVAAGQKARLTFLSASTISQFKTGEIRIGHSPAGLLRHLAPTSRPALLKALRNARVADGAMTHDVEMRTGKGETRWLRLTIRPTSLSGGGCKFDVLGIDITDQVEIQQKLEESRRETNNQLIEIQKTKARLEVQSSRLFETASELTIARDIAERASQAKTLFLSNMSHELRTPLNAIIGFSEIIKHETLGPVGTPRYADYAADIHQAGHHLLELINEILDFAKIEAGKGELREEEFCVKSIVQSMLRMVSERAERGMVGLELDLAEPLPSLRADKRKFRQILLNLLSNAIKFSNQGGTVTICAYVDNARGFVLEVRDTGIGMAPEDIPAALDVFGQIDSTLNRRHDGTGLGLPLTRALTEMHGGRLEIQSELDAGTTVTVTFPMNRVVPPVTDSETPTAVSF